MAPMMQAVPRRSAPTNVATSAPTLGDARDQPPAYGNRSDQVGGHCALAPRLDIHAVASVIATPPRVNVNETITRPPALRSRRP
jgi:hypothetical protein